jgi:hypothetical protein
MPRLKAFGGRLSFSLSAGGAVQGNLALFTRDLKKDTLIPAALRCLQRAHYLASLVCGPHHPDSPNTLVPTPDTATHARTRAPFIRMKLVVGGARADGPHWAVCCVVSYVV